MRTSVSSLGLQKRVQLGSLSIGRLGDKAALVRKAAMNLLATMLGFNPFAPKLPSAAFAESLREYEAKLKAMSPADAERDVIEEGDEAAAAAEEEGDDGAAPPSPSQAPVDDAEETQPSQAPVDVEEETGAVPTPELDGGVEAVRTMVAALKTALGFSVQMGGAVGVLCRLLASSTASDAIEATGLLVRLRQFGVDGADEGVRRMLGLVFSRDQAVRDAAVEAVDVLFLAGADSPAAAAAALADVASAAALGELAALEEVIKMLVAAGRVPPNGAVMRALWAQATAKGSTTPDCEGVDKDNAPGRAAALTVLCMAAATHPEVVAPHVNHVASVLDAACGGVNKKRSAPTLARAAAALLARARPGGNAGTPSSAGVATPALAPDHPAFAALARVLSPNSSLPGRGWYPAAEQSIAALYALHPDPEGAASDVVRSFAAAAFPEMDATSSGVNAGYLSRFLFVLGEVALKHLVHTESLARAVRRARVARDRRAAEASEAAAAKGVTHGEEAELAAALGQGAVAEDTHLDNAREAAEAELLSFTASAKGAKVWGIPVLACVETRFYALLPPPPLLTFLHAACCERGNIPKIRVCIVKSPPFSHSG